MEIVVDGTQFIDPGQKSVIEAVNFSIMGRTGVLAECAHNCGGIGFSLSDGSSQAEVGGLIGEVVSVGRTAVSQ